MRGSSRARQVEVPGADPRARLWKGHLGTEARAQHEGLDTALSQTLGYGAGGRGEA